MVAVEMDRLFVVGDAGVLRAGMGLVEADVVVVERPLGEVDDGGMDAHSVEGPLPGKGKADIQRCWAGRKPGPSSGQTKASSGCFGRPRHCS